jgi:AcrR family transcriptional regulator
VSPRPKLGHIRKPQIVQAAQDTMYERGFHETRISDIAERAGTSAATILYYFASKEALLEEALTNSDERFYASLREEIGAFADASSRLVHVIERCATPPDPLDDWTLWIEMWMQVRYRPHMREAYERLERTGLRAMLADIVREGQDGGEFGEADADDVATTLSALLDGLGVQVTLHHPDIDAERMVSLCLTMASKELGCDLHRRATRQPREEGAAG